MSARRAALRYDQIDTFASWSLSCRCTSPCPSVSCDTCSASLPLDQTFSSPSSLSPLPHPIAPSLLPLPRCIILLFLLVVIIAARPRTGGLFEVRLPPWGLLRGGATVHQQLFLHRRRVPPAAGCSGGAGLPAGRGCYCSVTRCGWRTDRPPLHSVKLSCPVAFVTPMVIAYVVLAALRV